MQKILFLILLLFTFNATAQLESLSIDSVSFQEIEKFSVVLPFSSDSLKKLPVISKNIIVNEKINNKSFFFLFLLNLIAIAVFLLTISRSKVKKLIGTIFSLNVLMQYAKVEIKRDNSYLWAYFILSIMFLATVFYVLSLNFHLSIDVLKLTLLVLGFLIFDFFVIIFSAFIFKLEALKDMSHFNNFSFIVVLLPFFIFSVLFLLFLNTNNSIIGSSIFFIVIISSYLWKEVRNLLILKANRINIFSFYFFLYLCTFKILPLAIFFKIVYGEVFKN